MDFSVSLFSTSYLGGVFVLLLHHKDNVLLSILVYNRVQFALVLHHKDKYSYQYWFTIGFCSPWFCVTKTTNASQLIGRLEVKPFLNLKIY